MNKAKNKLVSMLFSVGLLASAFVVTSCDDDEKTSIRPDVEIPDKFSERTVEQNKAALEDNGLELVSSVTALQNTAGVQTSISFVHFLSEGEMSETAASNKATNLMRSLSRFGLGKEKAADVLKDLRIKEDEPETLGELFDENEGVYAYNSTTDEWDFTAAAGSGKIEFKFPSTQSGTTNNATFAIHSYTSVTVNNEEAEYEGELPTGLKADLTVGTTKQIEYVWSAAYKANGEPTSVETSLTIGAFKLSFKVKNTTSEVSVDYALTENGSNLLSLGAGASGNFTTEVGEDAEPGDVVTSASAYFQIMDIKFAGEVDVKNLAEAMELVEDVEEEAEVWNEHATFVVFYAEENEKIANLEFYGTISEVCDEYDWNGDGIPDDTFCYDDSVIEVRLVFADGSKSDLETYTEVGFAELEEALEDFFNDLEGDIEG